MTAPDSNSVIVADYRARTPGSAALHGRARRLLPDGIAHDSRRLDPYPPYIEHAAGARKWDVDGNEYVDYFGGHGALLLGHCHPDVTEAVRRQLERGSHFGTCHALELRWAELIAALVPAAERVRFTNSGTEATLLALRLARAATGRTIVVRFASHFHGWHDHLAGGYLSHFDGSAPPGVAQAVAAGVRIVAPNDEAALAAALAPGDVAAVILEPTGGSFGHVPMPPAFLEAARRRDTMHGALLIFDEVITGFRVAPGGAQGLFGVAPDLSTFAKIAAGGLPGGVVAGRAEVMARLDSAACAATGREKVMHFGTFNANPLSAAAAVATLELVASTDACARANATAAELRAALNQVLAEEGVNWAVYGTFSGFHVFTNPDGQALNPRAFDPLALDALELKRADAAAVRALRLELLARGVDLSAWPGGVVSAVHGPAEIEQTVAAWRGALRALKDEGLAGRLIAPPGRPISSGP